MTVACANITGAADLTVVPDPIAPERPNGEGGAPSEPGPDGGRSPGTPATFDFADVPNAILDTEYRASAIVQDFGLPISAYDGTGLHIIRIQHLQT